MTEVGDVTGRERELDLSRRLNRRVLLTSAAGLGLSLVAGPVGRAWARESPSERRRRLKLEKRLQEIIDGQLRLWNTYRSQITVGPSPNRSERSPLQQFAIGPQRTEYVKMHIDYLFKNFTYDALKTGRGSVHKGKVYRDTQTGELRFHYENPAETEGLEIVYWGSETNVYKATSESGYAGIRNFLVCFMHDIGHGRRMIDGCTLAEVEAGECNAKPVGIALKRALFRDGKAGWLGIVQFRWTEPPRSRGYEPVIFPEGTEETRYGRSWIADNGKGTPVLAKFRRVGPSSIKEYDVKLIECGKRSETAVPGRSGTELDCIFFIPGEKLKKNTHYRSEIYAKIQRTFSDDSVGPVVEGRWTREFWTGKNDFGP